MKNKILYLIRERRKYEVRTLDGYKSKHKLAPKDVLARTMYNLLSNDIEIEMKTISGQNKTILRKDSKYVAYRKRHSSHKECEPHTKKCIISSKY